MTDRQQEPKIIVDDDWKARVQAEKEALKKESQSSGAADAEPRSQRSQAEPPPDTEQLPPPSFPLLVSMVATQALIALGQVPDPQTQQPVVRLPLARHLIDMLAVLQEKSKGNLSSEESQMIQDVLHDLRMTFVAVGRESTPQK